MPGFKRSITIERPIEQVFDFATDLANVAKLMPSVTKTEMLTQGGMKPGAKFRETRLIDGKEKTAEIEVVEHKRPEVHSARSAMMGVQGSYTFRFFPEGAGTRVEMLAEISANFLMRPFLGMIVGVMEKEDGDYLARLKEALMAVHPT